MKSNTNPEGRVTKEMMMKYFETYSRSWEEAALAYFTEDIVFENIRGEEYSGRKNIIDFWKKVHIGNVVKEHITPVRILVDGDDVAAEIVIEFEASEDVPGHIVTSLKKGEKVKRRFSAFYRIRGGKIAHVTVYPPTVPTPKRM